MLRILLCFQLFHMSGLAVAQAIIANEFFESEDSYYFDEQKSNGRFVSILAKTETTMVQVTKSKNRSVWMIEKKFLPERNRDQAIEDKPLWAGVGFIRKVPVGKDNCLLNLPSELNHLKGKLRIKTKGMQLKAATICEFEIYFNHKNDYAIEIMQSMARDNTLVDSGIAPIEILVEDPLQKIELGSIWEELSVLKNRVLTYDGALISLIYAMSKKLPDQVFLQLSDHLREGISDAFVHLFQVDVDAYQLVTRSELKKDAVWLPSSYSSQIINL